jgi:hypothetical protein
MSTTDVVAPLRLHQPNHRANVSLETETPVTELAMHIAVQNTPLYCRGRGNAARACETYCRDEEAVGLDPSLPLADEYGRCLRIGRRNNQANLKNKSSAGQSLSAALSASSVLLDRDLDDRNGTRDNSHGPLHQNPSGHSNDGWIFR